MQFINTHMIFITSFFFFKKHRFLHSFQLKLFIDHERNKTYNFILMQSLEFKCIENFTWDLKRVLWMKFHCAWSYYNYSFISSFETERFQNWAISVCCHNRNCMTYSINYRASWFKFNKESLIELNVGMFQFTSHYHFQTAYCKSLREKLIRGFIFSILHLLFFVHWFT